MTIATLVLLMSLPLQHADIPEDNEVTSTDMAVHQYFMTIRSQHGTLSGGTRMVEGSRFRYDVDADRQASGTTINALCAVVVDGDIPSTSRTLVFDECKKWLLRAIAHASQASRDSPYRAAGENELRWKTQYATIATGELIFVIDGTYVLPPSMRSCRSIGGCCDPDGALQLGSCRTPTAEEQPAIDHCQKQDHRCLSDEYYECLRQQGLKVGCYDQPDGSRLCY